MSHDQTAAQYTQSIRGIAAEDLSIVCGAGGFAASQARYLMLTARKSDLELLARFASKRR